ncbi:response regulator [bacterium]|nr:response regulator [bacterium]
MKDGKHVILCIDDDQDILESLRVILEANNYLVETAPSADDGLQLIKSDLRPDLIIVDLMMEQIDAGAQFVKDLRGLGCTMPIYMLSSTGDSLVGMVDFHDLGLDGVFQKPLHPDQLLKLLKSKLQS